MRNATFFAAALVLVNPWAWGAGNELSDRQGDQTPATPEFRQFERVEITGSALYRPAESRALPVEIITREDIRRSGRKSTSELIQALPYMTNVVEAGQFLSSNGGYSNAAIHGMPNGTLVLVNGVRITPYGRQSITGGERTGVDLDNLPLIAIDRVEVLTDGASSLYGTDALAGVVNIIMNEERKGLSLSADKTRPAGGAAQTETFSIAAAKGSLLRDGFHLRAELEHSSRGALMGSDRPSLSQGYYNTIYQGQALALTYPLANIFSSPATLMSPDFSRVWNPAWRAGNCPSGWVPSSEGRACLQNQYPAISFYPAQQRTALHARAEVLAPGGQKLFADVLWGSNEQQATVNTLQTQRRLSPADPIAAPYLSQAGMGSGAIALWTPATARPVIAYHHSTWRAQAGLSGQHERWAYQASGYYSQSDTRWHYARNFSNEVISGQTPLPLDAGWFGGEAGTALQAQLEQRMSSYTIDTGKTTMAGAQASAQRELWEMEGGPAQLAIGTELRRESSAFRNENGLMPQPDFNLRRNVWAAFAELRTPWSANFESTASVRADRYDQFSSVNGKLSALWRPADAWQVRGAWGTGFRAPQTAQLSNQQYLASYAQVPTGFTCPAAIAARLGANCSATQRTMATYSRGSDALEPETSHQMTLGLRHDFSARLSLSADYWRVAMRNEIGQESSAAVLLNAAQHEGNFTRDGNGNLALFLPLRNVASSLKEGIDYDLRWRYPLARGRISLQAMLTQYLQSWKNDGQGRESDLGRISALTFKPTPRYRAQALLAYNTAQWSAGMIASYRSAFEDLQLPGFTPAKIPAFATVDLVGQYSVNARIDLRVGLYNVADKMPAQGINSPSILLPGIDTAYANLWGRTLRIGATYKF